MVFFMEGKIWAVAKAFLYHACYAAQEFGCGESAVTIQALVPNPFNRRSSKAISIRAEENGEASQR